MTLFIILGICCFIVSIYKLLKKKLNTAPKEYKAEVMESVLVKDIQTTGYDDKMPYFENKYRYFDGYNEKFVTGKSTVEYHKGEQVKIYIKNEKSVKRETSSSMYTIVYALFGCIFEITAYLFYLLNNGAAFGANQNAQMGVLAISCLGFLISILMFVEYVKKRKMLKADNIQEEVIPIKDIKILTFSARNRRRNLTQLYTIVGEYVEYGIPRKAITPAKQAIPPKIGDSIKVYINRETKEVDFKKSTVELPLAGVGVALLSTAILLYYLMLIAM